MARASVGSVSSPTVLVTGSTGGIGEATAQALAKQGAQVLMVGRNPERGHHAADEIARVTSGGAHFCRLATVHCNGND